MAAETELSERIKKEISNYHRDYLANTISSIKSDQIESLIFQDQLYGFWFELFSESPRERQQLIEYLVDKGKPSGAYLLLSHMISKRKFMNIFTTNFDDLLNDSLVKYSDVKPRVYSHNEISCYINPFSDRPNIIKLHGDFLFDNIKNIPNETSVLQPNMKSKLEEALKNNLDLIVVGYNGADDSVMDALNEIKASSPFAIYWCARNEDNLNWKVISFLNHHPNSYFIQIPDFEYLTYKIYQRFEDNIEIPDFAEHANSKQEEFNNFLSDFQSELTSKPGIDEEEKAIIKASFKIVLDRNSFYEFQKLPSEGQKKQYLLNLRIDGISRTLKNIHTNISWSEAKWLYEQIDNGSLFIEKVKETPIQHISNAFSNLKKIDPERTFKILDSIPSDILESKISEASDNDAYSGIYELSAIHPDKINEIKRRRNIPDSVDINSLDLRSISYKLKTSSISSAKVLIANEFTFLSNKLQNSNLKDTSFFLTNLAEFLPNEARELLLSIEIDSILKSLIHEDLNQIGMSIALFSKLDKKYTSQLINQLDYEKLADKSKKLRLNGIQNSLREINNWNSGLATQLFEKIPDQVILQKIRDSDLIATAEAFNNLKRINPSRVDHLVKSVDDEYFLYQINKSSWTYQHFGNVHEKLLALDFNRFSGNARKCDVENVSSSICATIHKTGEQIFLHLIPTYFKTNKYLLEAIIKKCPNEYIDSVLNWTKVDLYTVNLPYLKRIFEKLNMTKENEFVNYIISNNQQRFEKKKRKKTTHNRH